MFVTKCRRRRDECVAPRARGTRFAGRASAGVLVEYAEEPKERGYPLAGRAVCVDDCGTAVENLCIVPANAASVGSGPPF